MSESAPEILVDHYKLPILQIHADIAKEIQENRCRHYIYKDFHFAMHSNKVNKYLVVFFHGSIPLRDPPTKLPVFRGIEYRHSDKLGSHVDIVSLSDKLLDIFPGMDCGFYMSTPTLDHNTIYKQIIGSILSRKSYTSVIFTGASAGSVPAYVFSSIFNKICFIQNPVINPSLERHRYRNYIMIASIIVGGDDIHNFIKNNPPPLKTICYSNVRDKWATPTHSKPFEESMHEKHPGNLEMQYFIGGEPIGTNTHHCVNLPPGKLLHSLLQEVLDDC